METQDPGSLEGKIPMVSFGPSRGPFCETGNGFSRTGKCQSIEDGSLGHCAESLGPPLGSGERGIVTD